ncbi:MULTISPECIES: HNH endonuclease [unclassified Conexibacter]|uniref:HNH endonuclease n=1 Tax=unclassified Conexibacter TaxID=2627773 RepID=UPI00351C5468
MAKRSRWTCPRCLSSPADGPFRAGRYLIKCPTCQVLSRISDLPPRIQLSLLPSSREPRGPAGLDHLSAQLRRVFQRDRGICWLCQLPVDPWAPGKRRPSRDHVWPRSLGGTNRQANLRLAHADCNARRGAPAVATSTATNAA